jgi:uncharacterized protein (TIGR03118 family)
MSRLRRIFYGAALAAALTLGARTGAQVPVLRQTNLVTDDQSVNKAVITDPNAVNMWGISFSGTSPFWVSNNGTGTATLYRVNGANIPTKVPLTVAIPGDGSVTGQVFNSGNGAGAFNGDLFLFVSEDGTVSGWRGALGTTAERLQVGSADNVYKGSAFATVAGHSYLYAANFHSGSIDVFKGDQGAPALAGNFTDPGLPSGFAPFNVQNLGGKIYVTYAKQDAAGKDEVSAPGNGFVSVFDVNGNFLNRVGTMGTLNSPWGLAIAPSGFGMFSGDLLVGNFGDGRINAFDLATNTFVGQLGAESGGPISIDGLWGLTPGNGVGAGLTSYLYFSAGPNDENHGLFGSLQAVPEPGIALVGLAALLPAGLLALRRRRANRAG